MNVSVECVCTTSMCVCSLYKCVCSCACAHFSKLKYPFKSYQLKLTCATFGRIVISSHAHYHYKSHYSISNLIISLQAKRGVHSHLDWSISFGDTGASGITREIVNRFEKTFYFYFFTFSTYKQKSLSSINVFETVCMKPNMMFAYLIDNFVILSFMDYKILINLSSTVIKI